MQRTFTTPDPVSLYVELRSGDLVVTARDTDRDASSRSPAETPRTPTTIIVEQHGDEITVIALARQARLLRLVQQEPVGARHGARPTAGSSTKLGSADVRAEGRLGRDHAQVRLRRRPGRRARRRDRHRDRLRRRLRSASSPAALRVKCGSGDVTVDRLGGPAQRSRPAPATCASAPRTAPVSVKSGSGNMRVQRGAGEDVALEHRVRRPGRRHDAPGQLTRQERVRRHQGRRPRRRTRLDRHQQHDRRRPLEPRRAPVSPRTARTSSSCAPRPSAATSTWNRCEHQQ